MNTGRKIIALITVFLMVFGNLPAIAVADADHPYYYTNQTSNSGSIQTSAGTKSTAQIQVKHEDGGSSFWTYCADSSHNLRSEHYRIAPLTDGNIRAIVNANIGSILTGLGINLDNSERVEAVQAAIWHFSNGINLSTEGNDAGVVALYNALIALPSAGAGGLPTEATVTLELTNVTVSGNRLNLTFRYKSSVSSVALTPSTNEGTIGTVTTDGDWKVVTVTDVRMDRTINFTVSGSQTLNYGASFFIPESADNGGTLGQKLVGTPPSRNVTVSATFSSQYGGLQLKKAFSSNPTTADRGEDFSVTISGGPGNSVSRVVTVPGDGSTVTVTGLPFGNYTVTENLTDSQKANYTKVSIVNSDTNDNTVVIDSTQSNKNGTVTVTNQQLGSITITKKLTPADTTSTFTFNISGPSFPAGGENFTLKHGESKTYSALTFGSYTVTEQGQAGYRLTSYSGDGTTNGGSRVLTLDNGHRSLSFTANNEKRGSIVILKTDTITNGPVAGVTFHITGPNGFNQTIVTDATGRIDIGDLAAGTYIVTETAVPVGYRINNPAPVSRTIGIGGTATFNFSDDPVGRLNLIKQDMAGNPLPGAVFWVSTSADFSTHTVYDTGANSSILTDWMLASGTYYVKEVKAPAGYVIPAANTKSVVLVQGQTTPVTFNDPKDEGSLLIKKLSSYQDQPVAGATFQLARDAGFTDLVTLPNGGKTDANGELLVENLPSGSYYLRESAAAANYDFNITDVRNVTITYNNRSTANFVNHPQGRVRIIKTDSFNSSALAGAVFGVYSDPGATTLVATLAATDANGLATSGWLPFSTGTIYYVKEISAPARYAKSEKIEPVAFTTPGQTAEVSFANDRRFGGFSVRKELTSFAGDTQSFTFTITGPSYPNGYEFTLANGQIKNFPDIDFGTYTITETVALPYELTGFSGGNGTRNGNSYTVVLGSENQQYTVVAANHRLGSLSISKALQEGVTGDTADFNFTITGPGLSDSFTLKAGGSKPYANLPYGTYVITELPTADGYRLNGFAGGNGTRNGSSYTVVIGTDNLDVQVTANNLKLGKLEVVKTEAGSEPTLYLPGAVFGIYRDAAATDLVMTMAATGADGHAVSGWLDPGTYYVKEITAPAGYVLNTIVVTANVTAGSTALLPAIENTKNEGSIRVTKLDRQTGDPVEGVTFQLLDKDPRTSTDFTVLAELTTNSSGVVEFLHLVPGTTYYVRETHQAPGYSIDITDVRAVTAVLAQVVDVEFQNDQVGDFRIVKTDGHGNYLPGAEFQVSRIRDDFSGAFTLTTGADGKVTSELLTVGTWYVKETKAPYGYAIDDTSVKEVQIVQFTTAEVSFTDTRLYGKVQFSKVVDNINSDPAVFTLRITGDNGYSNTVTVSEAGLPKELTDLPFGTYTVTEDDATGYQKMGITPSEFTINDETYPTTVQVTATNHKLLGSASFAKIVDNMDNDPATFTLNITGDNGYSNSVTVSETGAAQELNDLPFGNYTVAEAAAPGYSNVGITNSTFTVGAETYTTKVEVTATNHKLFGTVTFSKVVDNVTDDPATFTLTVVGPGYTNTVTVGEMLPPVTLTDLPVGVYMVFEDLTGLNYSNVSITNSIFTVTADNYTTPVLVVATNLKHTGRIQVAKHDADERNTPYYLEGAEFKISTATGADFDANVVETLTTGSDGKAQSAWLPLGTYWIKETAAPNGYVINNPNPVQVDITTKDTTYDVSFADSKDEGSILVRKISRMTEAPVEGVTFELLDRDPKDPAFTAANIIATAKTDANGEALFQHLETGKTFWVRETVPAPGYDIDPDNTQSVTVVFHETSTVYFANNPVGYVRVTKVDATDETKKLEGAVYGVYEFDMGANYKAYAEEDPSELPPPDYTFTTGPDGTGISGYIPFSATKIFLVIELKAPDGYLLNEEEFYVVQFTEPGEIVDLTFHNDPATGSLVILKVDALNPETTLAGAEFKLYKEEALINQVGSAVTSGADGIVRFDNLEPGIYWLKETKAPKDYDLLTDPIPLTVTAGVTEPEPLVIKNQYNPPKGIETGMMEWNILILGGLVLLAGLTLMLFARKRKLAQSK